MNRLNTFLLLIVSVLGQFDFDKEVAGLFDFGRLTSEMDEYTNKSDQSAAKVTAENIKPSGPTDRMEEVVLNEEEHFMDKNLPSFGKIQENIENETSENEAGLDQKKRSFGESRHGGGGYSGGAGGYGDGEDHGGGGYTSAGESYETSGGYSSGGGGHGIGSYRS